ncbi:hypothetical protein RFY44_22675, partial [Acinetobacter bereziniae]
QNYIRTNDQGQIEFDDNFRQMAAGAQLVLDEVTLQMLQHITTFTDEELKEALEAMASQQAKRRLKRKKA